MEESAAAERAAKHKRSSSPSLGDDDEDLQTRSKLIRTTTFDVAYASKYRIINLSPELQAALQAMVGWARLFFCKTVDVCAVWRVKR